MIQASGTVLLGGALTGPWSRALEGHGVHPALTAGYAADLAERPSGGCGIRDPFSGRRRGSPLWPSCGGVEAPPGRFANSSPMTSCNARPGELRRRQSECVKAMGPGFRSPRPPLWPALSCRNRIVTFRARQACSRSLSDEGPIAVARSPTRPFCLGLAESAQSRP